MTNSGRLRSSSSEGIYTLGQSGTSHSGNTPLCVTGKGSDLSDSKVIQGRAKRKLITQTMVLSLVDVAKDRNDYDQVRSYWNTYHCQGRVVSSGGKLYGHYCKNRFCTLCCSIRKAEMINKYMPVISQWEDTHFLTLTIKACSKKQLKSRVDGLTRAFKRIKDKMKKRHQRGKGIKLVGVKSMECNFNPVKRTYNPHLHLILASKEMADILIEEWLKLWTPDFANRKAQYARKVVDTERDLIEIVKYGSKIFTEPDVNKKSRGKGKSNIHVAALDVIFTGMKNKRIFDRFGFKKKKNDDFEKIGITELSNFKEWTYDMKINDWRSNADNEVLTGFIPDFGLEQLLDEGIDNYSS